MELFVLPLGACGCPMDLAAPGTGHRVDLPVLAYLLRLDDGRNVMIDTGMNRQHVKDPLVTWRGTALAGILTPSMTANDNVDHQLRRLGLRPDDIDFVINTHLHFDHAGNNDLFTRATFLVQREHYAAALGNPAFPNQYWNVPGLRFKLLDGDVPLFPGVEVIATPGHAPGHQSVLVRLPESGTFIISGDALPNQADLDLDRWAGQAEPGAARVSGLRLLRLAEAESATLLLGHDAQQAAALLRAPRGYR